MNMDTPVIINCLSCHLSFVLVFVHCNDCATFSILERETIPDPVNHNLEEIVTPVNVDVYEDLLIKSSYDMDEVKFLVNGFRNGFSLNYQGPRTRRDYSRNIPFTVGDKAEMWGHIIKEVKAGRYTSPYDIIPFDNFVQSPCGLVPKDDGKKIRLIFHLSYIFNNGNLSINDWTPKENCSVKYNDLDDTVANALFLKSQGAKKIFFAKTDLKAAFRGLLICREDWPLLILKAEDPNTGKVMYFIDKCLPFGASISCAHFQ